MRIKCSNLFEQHIRYTIHKVYYADFRESIYAQERSALVCVCVLLAYPNGEVGYWDLLRQRHSIAARPL